MLLLNVIFRNKRKLFILLCLFTTICFLTFNEKYLKIKLLKQNDAKEPSISDLYLRKALLPNQSMEQELICRLPKLRLTGHTNHEPSVKCRLEHEWGYLKFNRWHLNITVVHIFKNVNCKYRSINRIDDQNNNYSTFMELKDNQLVLDEVIEVTCIGLNGFYNTKFKYNNLHVQIVRKQLDSEPQKETNSNTSSSPSNLNCSPLNIILLSYDSLSRVSWFKRLPKSTEYVLNEMGFKLMYGQSIMGDGTPACMIPLLTGKLESEMPSTLKSDPNGSFVDQVYPFIWKELHSPSHNYVSFHMEDWPQVSAFTYRLKGMSNLTAHHYMRAYQTALWKRVSSAYFSGRDDFCIGNLKRHRKALNLLTEFIETYRNTSHPYLAIMHYIENSHDGNDRAHQLDDDLIYFLKDNFKRGSFKNTAIFLYSDHGARFSTERMTSQGYLEERMPFFSIYLPDSFRNQNPDKLINLIHNSQQLTTALDAHQTIRELTCLPPIQSRDGVAHEIRSMSLLNNIPFNRTCKDIGLPLHFCTCDLDWHTIDSTDLISRNAIQFMIDYMNNHLIKPYNDYCEQLIIDRVIEVKTVKLESSNYFKLNFLTRPNMGVYEAMIKYERNAFSIESPDLISRTNPYGHQPRCLENAPKRKNSVSDLRKFCLCKRRFF